MKPGKKSAFDQFVEIIGDRKHLLREEEYRTLVDKYNLKKSIAPIGPYFLMIGDLRSLKFLQVSEGSKDIIGYSPQEIEQLGANFTFQIVHPEDLNPCLQMIKTSWDFIKSQPLKAKKNFNSNFYYRAVKKDGTAIKVQLQVIPLEIDEDENINVTCNIITDITHLGLSDQVKLSIVDTQTNSCFSATAHHPVLLNEVPLLSKREVEILKLLTEGMSSRQIADKLIISYFTVRTHRKNILEKLGKKNTAEMISFTLYKGLI